MRIITFVTLIALFSACFALTSCNTVAGVGEDLQKGGRAIKDAAQ